MFSCTTFKKLHSSNCQEGHHLLLLHCSHRSPSHNRKQINCFPLLWSCRMCVLFASPHAPLGLVVSLYPFPYYKMECFSVLGIHNVAQKGESDETVAFFLGNLNILIFQISTSWYMNTFTFIKVVIKHHLVNYSQDILRLLNNNTSFLL